MFHDQIRTNDIPGAAATSSVQFTRIFRDMKYISVAEREGSAEGQRQEKEAGDGASSIARTDSPDNDSAFSDTVCINS